MAHIDICGPLPLSWEGHRYILVLGLRLLDDAPLLISARGLATRTSVEVTTALGEMVDELEDYDLSELPLSNGKRILKIQSDRAREFESRNFTEFCRARGLTRSVTKDYDPAANGTAERVVRLIKSGLRKLLAATAYPKASWGYLLRHLVQSYFLAAIGREQVSLPLGTLVIARTLAPRPSLKQRGVVGRLLFHDHLHDGSSYLLMDDDVVRCGYPVACPEDRDLLATACELDAVNLLSGIMTSKVGVPSRKLADDLGEASAKVRDRTSPRDEVDDLKVAESHGKGMALQPENAPRRVDDEQLELEDVLGVASAKVRDRTSLHDHAADPRVGEPSSKEPADEPPVDKSLLLDAGEIRRTFGSNDPGKACQAIGMQSLNVGGETAKRSQLERVQRSSQIQYHSLVPSLSVGQLERVQRSSQIQHPSLVPSLVQRSSLIQHPSLVPSLLVGQLEREQRSSEIPCASSVSRLDPEQIGVTLPERLGDATRQCSDYISPTMAYLGLVQNVSGRSFGRTVLSRELSFGDSSVERTFGNSSVERSFGRTVFVQRIFYWGQFR